MSALLQERQQPVIAPRLRDRVAPQRATPWASARHQPAATTVANGPVEAARAHWCVICVILGSIVATLREWRRRSVARRALRNVNAWILRDIGIDPSTVDYEMHQSFWRPLRDWRN